MRITKLTIAIMLIAVIGSFVMAQEETIEVKLYYNISEGNFTVTGLNNLVQSANAQLGQYGVEIVVEEDLRQNHPLESAIFIETFSPIEGTTIALVAARNYDLQRLSPILESEYPLQYNTNELTTDLFLALAFYNVSLPGEAEPFLSNHIESVSGSEAYFYAANIKLLQEDYDTALEYFDRILNNNIGNDVRITRNTAWLLWQTGRQEEALTILDDKLEEHQGYNTATISLLGVRSQLNALSFDYDSALADIESAIDIAIEADLSNWLQAELYTQRGEVIFLLYEWDRVEDNFNTAIELQPDYAPAYFQRGVLFYTMARREDALADFETYLELAQDGIYAGDAESYIESIEIELDALNG